MTLIKVQHDKNNPYTVINRSIADDDRISYKAMGLWFYAFSRKEDWQFYLNDLVKRHKDGLDSVKSGLNELEESGYLYRYKRRNEKNQFDGWEWVFFETPKTKDEIQKMFPKHRFSDDREIPSSAEPPPITNKDLLVTNENNNNPIPPSDTQPKVSSKSVVVVPSCLDELKLEPEHKQRLALQHSPETLRIAVSRVLAWSSRESDAAAIETVLERKETWVDKPNSDHVVEKNDAIIKILRKYDYFNFNGVLMVVGYVYVEFSGGVGNVDTLKTADVNFCEALLSKLRKLNAPYTLIAEIEKAKNE